jgi:acyl-CoA synthetase (AMP-forming)/AMP-acid ligase II
VGIWEAAGQFGDKPFLTWYDDDRGERVELSYRTFANWVAKTANLLVDELGAEPGDRVGLLAVQHWQTAVILAACWRAGVSVVVPDPSGGSQAPRSTGAPLRGSPDPSGRTPPNRADPPGLVAAFVREEFLAGAAAALGGTPRVVLTADLLGRGDHDLGGAPPYARVVPAMGDHFLGDADPQGDALTAGGEAATWAGLLDRAAALTARTGLGGADRVLSGRPLLAPAGAAAGLLAPFVAGAGVVLAAGFDPARFWKRVADERVALALLEPDQAAALAAAGPPPAALDRSRLRAVAAAGAGDALAAGFQATTGVPLLDA